jgi:hypothetical protein
LNECALVGDGAIGKSMSVFLKRSFLKRAILLSTFSLCSGCSYGIYEFGSYEASIERAYENEEEFVASDEIELLSQELQESRAEKIPPGKAAYVGYLHSLQNQNGLATKYFELEKTLFPESQPFMNRLITSNEAKR